MKKYNMTKEQRASVDGLCAQLDVVNELKVINKKPKKIKVNVKKLYDDEVYDYIMGTKALNDCKRKPKIECIKKKNEKEPDTTVSVTPEVDDYLKEYQKKSDSEVLEKFYSKYTPMPVASSSIFGNLYLKYNEKTDEYDVKAKTIIDYDIMFKSLTHDAAFMRNVPVVFLTHPANPPEHRVLTITSWSIDNDRPFGYIVFTGNYRNSAGHLVLIKVTFYKYKEQNDVIYKEIIINTKAIEGE